MPRNQGIPEEEQQNNNTNVTQQRYNFSLGRGILTLSKCDCHGNVIFDEQGLATPN